MDIDQLYIMTIHIGIILGGLLGSNLGIFLTKLRMRGESQYVTVQILSQLYDSLYTVIYLLLTYGISAILHMYIVLYSIYIMVMYSTLSIYYKRQYTLYIV